MIHPVNGSVVVADTSNNRLSKIMFMDHWTMAKHDKRTLQLRCVVALVVHLQHHLQEAPSRLQEASQALWLPKELWFLVFTFLHDLDFMHLRGCGSCSTSSVPLLGAYQARCSTSADSSNNIMM